MILSVVRLVFHFSQEAISAVGDLSAFSRVLCARQISNQREHSDEHIFWVFHFFSFPALERPKLDFDAKLKVAIGFGIAK